MKRYLCCFNLDTGITVLGTLHLNAFLFFFWRFTLLEPVWLWFDLMMAGVFAVRAAAWIYGVVKDDMFATIKSREVYYKANWIASLALAAIVTLSTIVYCVDWGHFPTLAFLGWLIVGGLNVYHWFVLKAFMHFEDQESAPLHNSADMFGSLP